jgi:hypothetical protein
MYDFRRTKNNPPRLAMLFSKMDLLNPCIILSFCSIDRSFVRSLVWFGLVWLGRCHGRTWIHLRRQRHEDPFSLL